LALLPLALAALCAGCTPLLERKPVEKQRFVLQAPLPETVPGARAGVLRVGVVRASTPFQNRGFVHRTGEESFQERLLQRVRRTARHPAARRARRMAARRHALRDRGAGLEAPPTGCWRWTSSRSTRICATRGAAGGDRDHGATARRRTSRAAIALQEHYSVNEPAADTSSPALAAAWNRALARVLGEVAADLDAARTRRASRARSR
jgi:hypothetical protein